jgi:hypothetical protein
VIEGGGWVGVGDDRARVQAGEAVVWPPDVLHAAWTDGAPMRAIVVEFAEPPKSLGSGVVEVVAAPGIGPGEPPTTGARPVSRGDGRLAERPTDPTHRAGEPDATEGEPL